MVKTSMIVGAAGVAALQRVPQLQPTKKKLDKPIFTFDVGKKKEIFYGWSITHFLLHGYWGYKYPERFWFFLLIGIGWEIFEDLLANSTGKRFLPTNAYKSVPIVNSLNESSKGTFFAQYSDIPVNVAGFLAGKYIREY